MSKNKGLIQSNLFDKPFASQIIVLGIGSILYTDEGFGVRVVEKMERLYEFPDNILLIDGGVLGISLLGVISKPDHLIVVDAIRNSGNAGDLYRFEGDAFPDRFRAKNSLHQVDFLEALSLCRARGKVPQTVIIGVEPEDIETQSLELSSNIQGKVDEAITMVLGELNRLGVTYKERTAGQHFRDEQAVPQHLHILLDNVRCLRKS